MKTNLFITGRKGIGKSFLLRKIIYELNLEVSGFRTLPYFIEDLRKGFYLQGLVELPPYENNMPICIQTSEVSCIPLIETFNTLGIRILNESMNGNKVILMDELGRLESKASDFVMEVINILNTDRLVIGVLKKEDIEFINNIKRRNDTLVFDLDVEDQDDIYIQMIEEIKERIKEYE